MYCQGGGPGRPEKNTLNYFAKSPVMGARLVADGGKGSAAAVQGDARSGRDYCWALKKIANYPVTGGFKLDRGRAGRSTEYIRF